jgi:hypothetical protein
MYDESLDPLTEQELRELEERALDRRVVAALEGVPDLSASIPADFAARVAAKVPAKRPAVVRSTNYGMRAMWAGLAVLLVAIVLFSSRATGQSAMMLLVEGLLLVQFVAIVAWLSVRTWREG